MRADLDEWLRWYNNERPHRGYRNMGRTPNGKHQTILGKTGTSGIKQCQQRSLTVQFKKSWIIARLGYSTLLEVLQKLSCGREGAD